MPAAVKPRLIRVDELAISVYVSRNCTINPATGITSFWWEISQFNFTRSDSGADGDPQGIVFFTWSEKVTGDLVQYSLITFYVVVVLGIGRVLRTAIQTNPEEIFIRDMPRPDSLLLLCEGILISRLENNLEREEELYYVLIDIMRSPEILKMITDTSLKKKND